MLCLDDMVRYFNFISVYDFLSSISLYIDSDEADKEKVILLYQVRPHKMYHSKCLYTNVSLVHSYFITLQLLLGVFCVSTQ